MYLYITLKKYIYRRHKITTKHVLYSNFSNRIYMLRSPDPNFVVVTIYV